MSWTHQLDVANGDLGFLVHNLDDGWPATTLLIIPFLTFMHLLGTSYLQPHDRSLTVKHLICLALTLVFELYEIH